MFSFRKNKDRSSKSDDTTKPSDSKGLLSRLRIGLARTRSQLNEGLSSLVLGKKVIDDELLDKLETQLLLADVGVDLCQQLIANITNKISRKQLSDPQALLTGLREDMAQIILPCSQALTVDPSQKPFVILVVGVNGVGKTTTIGKLAWHFKQQGQSVMLAAGDTFRAAAVEQLQTWGDRIRVPVIAQHSGADSASVVYDACNAARARGVDVLIADTAGRLHTQANLMDELRKIRRVVTKFDPTAPHEVLLVLDAGTGQNTLTQAKQFHDAVNVSGIALTKLDGTAKGGIIFAITHSLGVPIRFIGIGEALEDLRVFDAPDFINALFQPTQQNKPTERVTDPGLN